MDDAKLKLTKSPIIEAILDIECDLPPGQKLAELESAARERFRDHYPKFQTQLVQEHEFQAKPGGQAKLSVRRGLQAFQFLQDDGKQLVQVRVQGFSYNRLSPYTSLDDYLPEIERCWKLYVELASPVQVRSVRLRYINRILLPVTEGRVELDNYFKIGPRLPDEKELVLLSFVNQHAAVEVETGNRVDILLTAQPTEVESLPLPVILDIGAVATGPGEPKDWSWILSRIMTLRGLANRVFRKSLSKSCLELFQYIQVAG
jgi:uncharacterized protein (TIGR04255 family)